MLIFQQASIEANLERKRQERLKIYAEGSDDDSDTGSSEASTKEMEVSSSDKYNINDKNSDEVQFLAENPCFIILHLSLPSKFKGSFISGH